MANLYSPHLASLRHSHKGFLYQAESWTKYYWLLLAEGHLMRRLFGSMVRRIAALLVPTKSAGWPRPLWKVVWCILTATRRPKGIPVNIEVDL